MSTSNIERELGIRYKHSIAEIRMKFHKILELSELIDEVRLRSDSFYLNDIDFCQIQSLSLLLTYKSDDKIILYSIIKEFAYDDNKIEDSVKLFTFTDAKNFFDETSNLTETGDLIGNIMYEVLTDSMRASMDGYSQKPYIDGLDIKAAIVKWL